MFIKFIWTMLVLCSFVIAITALSLFFPNSDLAQFLSQGVEF